MCGDKNTWFMSNGGKAHNFVVALLNSNFSAGGKVQSGVCHPRFSVLESA